MLRKIDDQNFCVFLSHEKESEFICLSIVCNQSDANTITVGLTLRHKVPAPQMDLADFDATCSHIWTLWSNAEGEFNVSAIFLDEDSSFKWVSAALEPPPDRYCLTIEQGVDPREAYCSYIFHPGRFDSNVIAKALYVRSQLYLCNDEKLITVIFFTQMFMRSNIQFDIKQITMGMLKEQVCQTVEDEIQNELKDFVVSDDEYLEIATRLWDRFYSCCEQYHVKFSEPTGLSVLGAMDAVCIIRRQSFALLRPCEMLEHLMLVGEHNTDVASFVAPYCQNDIVAAHGFIELMEVINQLEKILSEDIKIEMEKKIYQRDDKVLSKLLMQITKGDENNDNDDNDGIALPVGTVERIKKKLLSISIVDAAINMLLDFLAIVDEDAYPDSAGILRIK